MKKINDDTVRWGVIGVGDVCEVKSAPAMQLLPDSELVAVMRRDEAKVKDYADRHGVSQWFTDADALIQSDSVNAIYIATPPHLHKDFVIKAAEAGKPVYVEKPMARTYAECLEMVHICEQANVPLYVAYYRRALPHFVKIKELIEEGVIGEIRHVQILLNQPLMTAVGDGAPQDNWRVNPALAGGGYFYDLASHQLDFLDYALGPISTASGAVANQAGAYAAEDMVVAHFQFESGVMGSGAWSFSAGEACDHTVIYGAKGSISYETFGAGKLVLSLPDQEDQVFEFDLPKHIQMPLIELINDDILGRGLSPSIGRSAMRTNKVMEDICGSPS